MRINSLILVLLMVAWQGCRQDRSLKETEDMERNEGKNRLAGSTSPYLLQHANNPVDWYPWGKEALEKARKEDKPILVSIGYSSCHWCHVMEKESFENDSIAEIMNENFICIKVDREERPDVDQIYMDAVQAMGIQGGWPLNVFLTPDQRPFYGGTYFPPKNWAQLLTGIHKAFVEKRDEIEKSAGQVTDAIGMSELLRFKLKPTSSPYTMDQQQIMFEQMKTRFDTVRGGQNRAPKFPMPSIWQWLLKYGVLSGDQEALDQVHRTLTAMAYGGIYDQVGGGFARYSTDADWLVPHFEKMLYDNAQLLSLYGQAYRQDRREIYKDVMVQTIEWLGREMTSEDGGFYSALDADSEGVEGKFYVWTFREFQDVLGDDAPLLSGYFQVSAEGNWEGVNILNCRMSDQSYAEKKGMELSEWRERKARALRKLQLVRSTRVRPGLDNKILTGWNAMMISGLLDAYDALGDPQYLDMALRNAHYLMKNAAEDDRLYRTPPSEETVIDAYLEDYAFMIAACIDLYERTFDEKWLRNATGFTVYVLDNFLDPGEDMFFYTDGSVHDLVVRKKEIFDNVIPSSNSKMAENLFRLGRMLDREDLTSLGERMMSRMKPMVPEAISDMAGWAQLHLLHTRDVAEVVFVGTDAPAARRDFVQKYIPNMLTLGTEDSSDLPLVEGKSILNDRVTIYVCYNKTCKLPVNSVEAAYAQMQ